MLMFSRRNPLWRAGEAQETAALPSQATQPSLVFAPQRTRWLYVAAGVIIAGGVLSAEVLLSHLHERTIRDAERELSNLSLVLATYTENTFRSVELLQTSLVEKIHEMDLQNVGQFNEAISSREIYEDLRDRALTLPQVEALFLTNAEGVTVASTRAWPQNGFSIADRPHFRMLQENPGLHSYLAPPGRNVQTDTWNIYLSRRLETVDGHFLGIVGVALSLVQYEEFLGLISLGDLSSIALWRHDGVLMARSPHVTDGLGRISAAVAANFPNLRNQSGGSVTRRVSAVDNRERLIAERALNGYPAEVSVTRSVDEILNLWRRQVVYTIAGLLLLTAAAMGTARVGARQLRNRDILEQVRTDLRISEEHRRSEAKINYLAHHDSLTGLANRLLLRDRLDDALARTQRGEACAIFCLDLDHFKEVNDTLGHPVGDRLLQSVTERILAEVREQDTVARLGGDEFVIIQTALARPQDASVLAQRLVERIATPFDLDEHRILIGASIGIAISPNDGQDRNHLLRHADLALYRAKAAGRCGYRFFEPEMNIYAQMRRSLQLDLRRAIEAGEFEIFFQSQICMKTRQVSGFEALLRWQHPERGTIMPEHFIPVAEETGLIVHLGDWVLQQACRIAAGWPGDETIAVNLSPLQFVDVRLVQSVKTALRMTGLPPARLELEITETVMLRDKEATLATMHQLKALGVSIALDDFGTGYSSLAYLQKFPFDKVKIDKGFVRNICEVPASEAIVRAIVGLCGALKMTITAEGVETEQQFEVLSELGCTAAQGFLFGRPCAEREVVHACQRTT